MSGSNHWSRAEVEAIVADYLAMLTSELAGTVYSKAAHRRSLAGRLTGRSEQSIEFKHANISAALLAAGIPYISGYKPRSNYQGLLEDVLAEQLASTPSLHEMAAADADRPIVVPEVDDILAVLTSAPACNPHASAAREPRSIPWTTNYIEREARNRSLGHAGELFVINFEKARLSLAGRESLADRVEHTSQVRGDQEGYDVLSYEESGEERLIEVKTTKYGIDTPFFITRNEVSVSQRRCSAYQIYRLFTFHRTPRLYTLAGSVDTTCQLMPATFLAQPR